MTGGGHVMRSLTLAQALAARGAAPHFLGPPAMAPVLDGFAPDMPRTPAGDRVAAAQGQAFDAVAIDHYGLAAPEHVAIARGRPTLVIDDLANRALAADLVLDAGPARKAADYLGHAPESARLLLGPAFAPVRPEFAALRAAALAWRGEPVQRILVSLGLTDLGGITSRLVERIRPRAADIGLDIVLGAEAPSLAGLSKIARRDSRLLLHVATPHMARLTAEADIAIGAPGSSTWERCVLGLPSITVILAENQRPAAKALADRDAALVLDPADSGFDAAFDHALWRLLRDADLRRRLAANSAALCDGEGAGRVADAFLTIIAARAAGP
jgi:UDP-2,4-diacetamido-2,4,6-trideoxy-beta-L-altropyranose hydrolase